MNAIVQIPRGRLTPVKDPERLALKAQVAELRRQVRSLRKELKEERAHAVFLLGVMRNIGVHRASALLPSCQCDECTCTPTRSEMLRGR
jgi:hypothetical protein